METFRLELINDGHKELLRRIVDGELSFVAVFTEWHLLGRMPDLNEAVSAEFQDDALALMRKWSTSAARRSALTQRSMAGAVERISKLFALASGAGPTLAELPDAFRGALELTADPSNGLGLTLTYQDFAHARMAAMGALTDRLRELHPNAHAVDFKEIRLQHPICRALRAITWPEKRPRLRREQKVGRKEDRALTGIQAISVKRAFEVADLLRGDFSNGGSSRAAAEEAGRLWLLMCATGMGVTELFVRKWECKGDHVTIYGTKAAPRIRTVPAFLPESFYAPVEVLKQWSLIDRIKKVRLAIAAREDTNARFHVSSNVARHCFGKWMLKAGIDDVHREVYLGHTVGRDPDQTYVMSTRDPEMGMQADACTLVDYIRTERAKPDVKLDPKLRTLTELDHIWSEPAPAKSRKPRNDKGLRGSAQQLAELPHPLRRAIFRAR